MTVPLINAYDATSINEPHLSTDQLAVGYDTQAGGGTGNIAWTPTQWANHSRPYPAIHIDQDANASDPLADILDVEKSAATENEIAGWIVRARKCYDERRRPGQRWPGIYCSVSNVSSAVALLQSQRLTNVPFWVADYSISGTEAARRVSVAMGPYPAIGYQWLSGEFFDTDVFSLPWVTTVSGKPAIQEDSEPMIFNTQTFAPLPPGKYSKLYLWRDFEPTEIRVAILRNTGKFDIGVHATVANVVTVVDLPTDAEAVSLTLEKGPSLVGYALA